MWASYNIQNENRSSVKIFTAVSPNGEQFITKNIRKFSDKYNLDKTCISKCLRGLLKQYKGWTFRYNEV